MKHEVITLNTKKLMAASLKKLVTEKSFSKVTVSEIICDCGVNRKTFYYHFEDIYALLAWTLEQEAIEVVRQFDLIDEYEKAICFVMDYVETNNDFLKNVYDSIGRDELKRFFYNDFIGIVRSVIEEGEQRLGVSAAEDFKQFLTQFYTEALAGILMDWIISCKKKDRGQTLRNISMVLRTTIPSALREAGETADQSGSL